MRDAETKYIIGLAKMYANYSVFNGNSNYMVFTTCSAQNFMEVPPFRRFQSLEPWFFSGPVLC